MDPTVRNKKGYRVPLSSAHIPHGADYAYQFAPASVHYSGKLPRTASLKKTDQWRSQAFTPPMPIEPVIENWDRTLRIATWKGTDRNHHANKFYKDSFHLLSTQDPGMSKKGHDTLCATPNAKIYRQTTLTPHLSVYNDDVGTFTRRRGKVTADVPLCLTSSRVLTPTVKMLAEGTPDPVILGTLSKKPIPAYRRDMSYTTVDSCTVPKSPTSKYQNRGPDFFPVEKVLTSPFPAGRDTLRSTSSSFGSPVKHRYSWQGKSMDQYEWSYRAKRNMPPISSGRTLEPASAYH